MNDDSHGRTTGGLVENVRVRGSSLRVSLLEAQAAAATTAAATATCNTPQTPQTPQTPGRVPPPVDPKTGFRYQWDASVGDTDVLSVRCKNISGVLHKSKLGSGGRGSCILVNRRGEPDRWYTPSEFEAMGGRANCRDWKRSIRYAGRSLQCLVEDGILQPHAVGCTCAACCDDTTVTGPIRLFVPYKRKKPKDGDQHARLASDDTPTRTPEPASGPPSPQDCVNFMLTPITSSNVTRTFTVGAHPPSDTIATVITPPVLDANNGADMLTPVTHTPASATVDFTEHRQWWQLEEMVNTLINYGQQVKQLLAQTKEQSMASKELALIQLRNQLEQEKRQAVSRARQEAQSTLLLTNNQTSSSANVDSSRQSPNAGDCEEVTKKCANCGRDAFSMCSLCHSVVYCSTFCQQKDWKNHADECVETESNEIQKDEIA